MEIESGHSGRKGHRGCLVSLAVVAVLVVAAALGINWWLNQPAPLPTVPTEYLTTVQSAARACPELSVPLLAAQIDAESHWNPEADSGQAQGIAQFNPTTWGQWGKSYSGNGKPDVWNPQDAIPSQAAFMCHLFRVVKDVQGDPTQLALAAYNAGENAVLKANGIPQIAETQNYVTRIETLIPKYTLTYAKQTGASASPAPTSS